MPNNNEAYKIQLGCKVCGGVNWNFKQNLFLFLLFFIALLVDDIDRPAHIV